MRMRAKRPTPAMMSDCWSNLWSNLLKFLDPSGSMNTDGVAAAVSDAVMDLVLDGVPVAL